MTENKVEIRRGLRDVYIDIDEARVAGAVVKAPLKAAATLEEARRLA